MVVMGLLLATVAQADDAAFFHWPDLGERTYRTDVSVTWGVTEEVMGTQAKGAGYTADITCTAGPRMSTSVEVDCVVEDVAVRVLADGASSNTARLWDQALTGSTFKVVFNPQGGVDKWGFASADQKELRHVLAPFVRSLDMEVPASKLQRKGQRWSEVGAFASGLPMDSQVTGEVALNHEIVGSGSMRYYIRSTASGDVAPVRTNAWYGLNVQSDMRYSTFYGIETRDLKLVAVEKLGDHPRMQSRVTLELVTDGVATTDVGASSSVSRVEDL